MEDDTRVLPAASRDIQNFPSTYGTEGSGTEVGGTTSSVRSANMARLIADLRSSGGGMTRAELASSTGLTPATISRLAQELLRNKLIREGTPTEEKRPGRPGTPLYLSSSTVVGVGVGIAINHIAGVAVDLGGVIMDEFLIERDNRNSNPVEVLSLARTETQRMIERLCMRGVEELCGLCIGLPAISDAKRGQVVYSALLNWHEVSALEYFEDLGIPNDLLYLDNDANFQVVAAVAGLGNLRDSPEGILYIAGDVGIGGALIQEGRIRRGERGWAGEIGHMTVQRGGPRCHCGDRGCLELYAGSDAIATRSGVDLAGGRNIASLVTHLKNGNRRALSAIKEAGQALGLVISNAVKLMDIRVIILGTYFSQLTPWLEPYIRDELRAGILFNGAESLEIYAAPPEPHPTAIGAALFCVQQRLESTNIR